MNLNIQYLPEYSNEMKNATSGVILETLLTFTYINIPFLFSSHSWNKCWQSWVSITTIIYHKCSLITVHKQSELFGLTSYFGNLFNKHGNYREPPRNRNFCWFNFFHYLKITTSFLCCGTKAIRWSFHI